VCLGTVLGVNSKLTLVLREAIVIPAATRLAAAAKASTTVTAVIRRLVIAKEPSHLSPWH
jgi:hypothetical protein